MNRIAQIERALIYFLYRVCRILAFPLVVFYFLYRCIRDPRYLRRFPERLGALPVSFQATPAGAIWLHAVSVGEAVSAAGLLRELRERSPSVPLYVSVGTVAGRAVAKDKLGPLADGLFYAPIDYAFAVRRALRRIRPAALVILETEIWPVLYWEAKRAGAAVVIVNGRISDRAMPRYRGARFLFRHVLRLADSIFTQSEVDRARYLELGAPPELVSVAGNLKYDAAPLRSDPPGLVRDLIAKLQPREVWIAASTMPGMNREDIDEEEAVVRAFGELAPAHPHLLVILVPRRPERFSTAEHKLHAAGIPYAVRSRNKIEESLKLPCVLLVDTIGELASLFPLADVVFMGGSLARRGGHNLLEPAACSRPIIVGPHMENFATIAAEFREHFAFVEIERAGELAPAVDRLLQNPVLRADLGAGAAELARRHRGSTRRAVGEILRQQDLAVPVRTLPLPNRILLWPLAQIWSIVSRWNQVRNSARARRLDTPVISIGGIGMGGAGKTPMAAYVAERLRQMNRSPAILTRGYRRQSIEKRIVVPAGEKAPVAMTGDEAQIFVQAGYAHVGIGADRWSTGRLVEQKLAPDIFVLDDGFQHRRLARDLDIVMIDSLNPFAGGAVFPLGRLRESEAALARAGAFVIVRTVPERKYEGIKHHLRHWNPEAPIFRATVEPLYWVNERTQQPAHPPEGPVAAFCGLANPATFWTTLKDTGISPVFTWVFSDHHKYTWMELQRLAAQSRARGSNVLLTTEKDAMNLPERAAAVLNEALVELYWLKVGIQVDDEASLLDLIPKRRA